MHWLAGAAVTTGICAAYLTVMWLTFDLAGWALNLIDHWRHR